MATGFMIGLLVGIALAAVAFLFYWRRDYAARSETDRQRAKELAELQSRLAASEAQLATQRELTARSELIATTLQEQMKGAFAEVSQEALRLANQNFLTLAETRFNELRASTKGDLEQGQRAIEALLEPLREKLAHYETEVRTLLERSREDHTTLTEQIKRLGETATRLGSETRSLAEILRNSAARGRWGEIQLRRIVELAGMLEHCDFDVQQAKGEGALRPDLVVHLPGSLEIAVDSKVPLDAYQAALEAPDDESRREKLRDHCRQLRLHLDSLAKKEYWEAIGHSPEFVVAFLPSEDLLRVTFSVDPGLVEDAIRKGVLIATPVTLVALLQTAAMAWRQDKMAEGAREIQALGQELYKRLATFLAHLAKVGKGLQGAVEAYNDAVGSLEHRVLSQARRFEVLGIAPSTKEGFPELPPITSAPRKLAPNGASDDTAIQH
jgi:DNA recombination protein RmuC